MSNLPALVLRDQMPTSYKGREPSAIPTPATTVSPAPKLNISAANKHRYSSIISSPAPAPPHLLLLCCCCLHLRCVFFFLFFFCIAPRVRGVRVFPCFFVSPSGAKRPEIVFRKRLGIAVRTEIRTPTPLRGVHLRNWIDKIVLSGRALRKLDYQSCSAGKRNTK